MLGYVAVLFVGGIVAGLVFVATVPRLLQRGLREDAVHPLYGIRYWLYRIVARTTNSGFFNALFGDSSAIVHYLRLLGYRFGRPLVQSGSNFGVAVRHENPYLSGVGSGTMVSDGLSFMNAEYSSTSFRLRRAQVGDRNFLGNNVAYPAGARTGDNCLLATKVMVPIDGPVRRDVGLLGSPAFEIPRTVQRDRAFDDLKTGRRAPPAAARQEPAQRGHRGAVPARASGDAERRGGARHGGPRPLHGARVLGGPPWPPSRGSWPASRCRSCSSGRSRRSGR